MSQQGLEIERIQHQHRNDNEDECEREEEALSLCDLPVSKADEEEAKTEDNQTEEVDDFDFGSLFGSLNALESEMCAADEVFSGGQMLPYRHSVSSEAGLSGFRIPSRSMSRSESMDRARFGSRSSSSRSSSTRSHQSLASSSTSTSSSNCSSSSHPLIKVMGRPKSKTRNQFHSYPSPKPQIRASSARSSTSVAPPGTKSTMWQVLRLGLVRTPEIELQDLKARNNRTNKTLNRCTSYNSNNGIINNNHHDFKINDLLFEMKMRKSQLSNDDKNNGGFFKSCKCSVGAVEPMPVTVRVKGNNLGTKTAIGGQNKPKTNLAMNEEEDKKLAQKKQQRQQQQQQQQHPRQGKQRTSHHRTFEWLIRDLSHASVLNS